MQQSVCDIRGHSVSQVTCNDFPGIEGSVCVGVGQEVS